MTMAVESPLLDGRTLALARIHRDFADPGRIVAALMGGDEVPGEVVSMPVYDPERNRVKS